ncbi:uncharacterized protein PG986_004175 [Apiospora aurea]|uniref:Ysc84 actin-binding domain-containing protein n=1 Tax=Apiospora aurea TaxID=335848 RepID=A0ABR1QM77_9PEZI
MGKRPSMVIPYQSSISGVINGKSKSRAKIPAEVIQQAKGIAISTTVRAGMWVSGSAGSGVVMARLPDGSNDWSPPSAFSAYTVGAGVILGADHTESVCVLNTDEAVRAIAQERFGFGAGLFVTAGPVGAGTASLHGDKDPVWIYSKSRGIFLGAQVDGTRFNARDDINEGVLRRGKHHAGKDLAGGVLRGEANPERQEEDERDGRPGAERDDHEDDGVNQ